MAKNKTIVEQMVKKVNKNSPLVKRVLFDEHRISLLKEHYEDSFAGKAHEDPPVRGTGAGHGTAFGAGYPAQEQPELAGVGRGHSPQEWLGGGKPTKMHHFVRQREEVAVFIAGGGLAACEN